MARLADARLRDRRVDAATMARLTTAARLRDRRADMGASRRAPRRRCAAWLRCARGSRGRAQSGGGALDGLAEVAVALAGEGEEEDDSSFFSIESGEDAAARLADFGGEADGGRSPAVKRGCVRICGFDIESCRLPAGAERSVLERLASELQTTARECALTQQQALRLVIGNNMDMSVAGKKATAILAWRGVHSMAEVRERCKAQQHDGLIASEPFPHDAEVRRVLNVNPCALSTKEGWPVSLWHIGTANSKEAAKASTDHLCAWSRACFEYVDLWLTELSEKNERLAGHIQVFNLDGVTFWQVTNTALTEKLKSLLSAGENYVEAVSHIFIVNSSSVFSMAWKGIKTLLPPRLLAKIHVSTEANPPELVAMLDKQSAARLPGLLTPNAKCAVIPPVLSPSPLANGSSP